MARSYGKHVRPPEAPQAGGRALRGRRKGAAPRHARRRRGRALKRAAIVAAACLAVAAIGMAALLGVARFAGDGSGLRALIPQMGSIQTAGDEGRTALYDGKRYRMRPEMTSVLLMGHDGRVTDELNGQVDFIVVAAIDTETAETTLIYVPRDTMVDVERTYSRSDIYADDKRMQIAAAFAYGSDLEHSAERMRATVSNLLFNVPIEYYLLLEMDGIGALADAVDGVELTAISDVPKTDMREGEPYVLRGDQARQYVVERDEDVAWSAMQRLERQEQFLRAFMDKLFGQVKQNPLAAMGVLDSVDDYTMTDLGPCEVAYLASMYLRHGMGGLEAVTLQGESVYNEQTGYEELILDSDVALRTLLDIYFEEA